MTSNPKPRKCEEKKLTALTRKAFSLFSWTKDAIRRRQGTDWEEYLTLLKQAKDYYLDNKKGVSSQEREYYKPRSKTSRDTPGPLGAGQVQLA